jgi:predicted alpha/beta hydrolase family esterase
MQTQIFIIPGLGNSGQGHWQTLWEQSLAGARRIEQHNWLHPVASQWVANIDREVAVHQYKDIFLVAHSMGCHAVAQYARFSRHRIAGALLVAPPDVELLEKQGRVSGFLSHGRRQLPFSSIVVASSNDPYASIGFSKELANSWGSRFVNVGDLGHINAASGIGLWPQGLAFLTDLTNPQDVNSRIAV